MDLERADPPLRDRGEGGRKVGCASDWNRHQLEAEPLRPSLLRVLPCERRSRVAWISEHGVAEEPWNDIPKQFVLL